MLVIFPKMNKLTSTNKKLPVDHLSRYVHIKNGFAFVVNDIVAVVDLKKYVENYIGFSDERESQNFDELLKFIEGKSFHPQYWAHLTKKVDVMVSEESQELVIDNVGYSLALINNDNRLDYSMFLEMARKRFTKVETSVNRMTFNGNVIVGMQKAFANELKKDYLKFDKPRDDAHIRFFLEQKPYIFGYFLSNEENSKYGLQNQYTLKFVK